MSNHKELIKHSGNYLIANIATKALAFIAIPIYTRLMTVEEYGIVNVFISIISFSPIIMTLNLEVAIGRYYYDAKDENDYKQFVGCSIIISSITFLLMSLITVLFSSQLSLQMSFPIALTLSIIPVSLFKITNSIFIQIYNPMMESKKIATFSSIQSFLAFGLSVVAVIILPSDKYYGYVIGNVVAMTFLWVYLVNQLKEYVKFSISSKHIKYILNYCIPYLPYSLSGIIIAQFGKLVISDSSGFASAGLYSFASNIALVMLVFIGLIHQAWNPFYYRYMNEKDYSSIDEDYNLIWRGTLILGCLLSLFSLEVGTLFGKSEYISSVRVIPVLAIGYAFYQWAFVYMRNASYAKQTFWMGGAVVVSGISNIVISMLLVPSLEEMGAAVAFMLSYAIMLVLTYGINKYILKVYSPRIWHFIPQFLICVPVYLGCIWINSNKQHFDASWFFLKVGLGVGLLYVLIKPYCERLKILLSNHFKKERNG